jgi:hypothetical protein
MSPVGLISTEKKLGTTAHLLSAKAESEQKKV